MAAGLGFKTFTTGEVLTAADVNGYLMQGVLVFASAAARDAAITSPQEGQFAFTKDTNGLWYYDGAAWVASGATGDIEGVTAGVGITGGGTSGTVTITNDMATTITASGDIVVGTGSGTYDNLPIGTTGQILTADTTVSPYKVKWSTPAGGASFAGCLLTMSAGLTATNATFTYWTWNTEVFDVGGYHDLSTNTNRITIPTGKSGYYLFVGYTGIATTGTASGYVVGNIEARNSAGTYQGNKSSAITFSGSVYPNVGISSIVYADAGDYFQLAYRQNSGGTYTTAPGTDAGTYFSCTYLGA